MIEEIPQALVGVGIMSEATRLRSEAQRLQRAWFASPNPSTQRAYAHALLAWGRAARAADAIAHAKKLLAD